MEKRSSIGSYAREAVGFVAGFKFSLAQTYFHEPFGDAHTGAVPPVAAHSPTGDVLRAFVLEDFIDVGVALQHREDVVMLEKLEDLGGIGDR